MAFITVRHNIEVAHRLTKTPGKCQQIHGHSMWVELKLQGKIGTNGLLEVPLGELEFGTVKGLFRGWLDREFDHHLLLYEADPWAQSPVAFDLGREERSEPVIADSLPGLRRCPDDPTTENIASWIAQWAAKEFRADAFVDVAETHVNKAGVLAIYYDGGEVKIR